MTSKTNPSSPVRLFVAAVLAWLIPGAGYWYLGQKNRAIAIFLTLTITYLIGVWVAGIELIDLQNARIWFFAQILAGLPTIIVTLLQNNAVNIGVGKAIDIGQVYTGIVGLLNLLCVLHIIFPDPVDDTPEQKPASSQGLF